MNRATVAVTLLGGALFAGACGASSQQSTSPSNAAVAAPHQTVIESTTSTIDQEALRRWYEEAARQADEKKLLDLAKQIGHRLRARESVVGTYSSDYYDPELADLDCADIGHEVQIDDDDPYNVDADGDGVGCEGW